MGIFINPNAIQDNSMAKDKLNTSLQTEIDNKQEALTLTVKDNGNIVLANIQGQSKEFMPATPSGDPMHYAYVAAGAEYNDTGADIVKNTPWADLADDDADKTVVHKAGYWYLNGLGDITTAQMRDIYNYTINFGISQSMGEALKSLYVRTNYFLYNRQGTSATDMYQTFYSSNVEVGKICSDYVRIISVNTLRYFATYNHQTKHFIGKFNLQNIISNNNIENAFRDCTSLKTINIYNLKLSISFSDTSMLTSKSVLYMINNEAATSPITITLHADVYNRCMANADILSALEQHTNISLASA